MSCKGREPNSGTALASGPAAGHSLSFYYCYCFMTLSWGLLVGPAAESCSQIWLPRLSNWCYCLIDYHYMLFLDINCVKITMTPQCNSSSFCTRLMRYCYFFLGPCFICHLSFLFVCNVAVGLYVDSIVLVVCYAILQRGRTSSVYAFSCTSSIMLSHWFVCFLSMKKISEWKWMSFPTSSYHILYTPNIILLLRRLG